MVGLYLPSKGDKSNDSFVLRYVTVGLLAGCQLALNVAFKNSVVETPFYKLNKM